mgnify:CR=1 FL=1
MKPSRLKTMKALISLTIALGVLSLNCSSPALIDSKAQTSLASEKPSSENSGQILPISARAVVGGEEIGLEVAKTPQQQALGLMYRTDLPGNRGMLFTFDPPRSARFWMENTLITLDMIFLRDGKIQAIAANVPPCTAAPCPTYGPLQTLIDQVIELRGGRASELGLKVGDRLQVEFLNPP